MRRYYKGSDIPFRLSIKDKGGVIIPLASFDSLEVIFRTSGEQYTKYYKGGGITENEDGTYRIYASENAFGLLPDGLLKYTVKYTLNGTHDEIRECETDIFIKTPKQFQPKANVQDKSITVIENNSVSKVIPDGGYEGLGEVTVNVEIPFPMEIKEVNITENESTTTITTGEGYSGMSEVNVNVKVPITIKLPNGIKFSGSNISRFPDGFDWSDVRDVARLFSGISTLSDVSNINLPDDLEDISEMFYQCYSLSVFPQVNYSECTRANDTYNGCYNYGGDLVVNMPKMTMAVRCFMSTAISSIDATFGTTGLLDIGEFVHNCQNLTSARLRLLGATDVYLADTFNNCDKLVGVDIDTYANVTRMDGCFNDAELFTGGTFNLPICTRLDNAFSNCPSLTKVEIYAPKVTDMNQIFRQTTDRDFSSCDFIIDTGTEVRDIACERMFQQMISNIVPKVKWASARADYMWQYYRGNIIDLSGFEMPNFTNGSYFFGDSQFYTKVIGLPEAVGNRITNAYYMFWHSCRLVEGVWFDTSNVTNAGYMYNWCEALVTVPEYDFSKVTDASSIFGDGWYDSPNIENLGGFVGLKCNLDLSPCQKLTHESLLNVINKAADVTASPATLYLGSTNLAKLTDGEKAIATSKGWTLA